MRLYTSQNCVTELTIYAPTLVTLLSEILDRENWIIHAQSGNMIIYENSQGRCIQLTDYDSGAILTGKRTINDSIGFPSIAQSSYHGVMIKRTTITDWLIFADDKSFYIIFNHVLYGFSYFDPLFRDSENYFVVGLPNTSTNQDLLVSTSSSSTSIFLEGSGQGFSLSQIGGASLYNNIDAYVTNPLADGTTAIMLSPIAIHVGQTKQLRGFIHDLFAFGSTFVNPEQIYTQGGYSLYCVVLENRVFGVVLHD